MTVCVDVGARVDISIIMCVCEEVCVNANTGGEWQVE